MLTRVLARAGARDTCVAIVPGPVAVEPESGGTPRSRDPARPGRAARGCCRRGRLPGRRSVRHGNKPGGRRRTALTIQHRQKAVVPHETMESTLALRTALPPAPRVATMPDVPPDRMTDGELIARVGEGDRGAFELLYRRYARPVFALALRRLGDRGRAEDAVQETFASVWRSARSYRLERGPGAPWLYAVARNAIIDRRRARVEPPSRFRTHRPQTPSPTSAPRRTGPPGASTARSASSRQRTRRAGARLLERPVAERDRRVPADPPRYGEDTNPGRPGAAGRPPGGRAHMSGPDFRELVGDDLPAEERARLQRVHDQLVAAGPAA